MKLEANFLSNDSTELYIDDEDYSVVDIIRGELWKDRHTVFAGLKTVHPLLRRIVIRVQTKDMDPIEALRRSCERSLEKVEEFYSVAKSALKERCKVE